MLIRVPFPAAALLIALLSTAIQIQGLDFEEVLDDHSLLHSPQDRGCGGNPLECFSGLLFGLYYRPLASASFAIEHRYHGEPSAPPGRTPIPRPWRTHNLFLHLLVVLLAFWFFRLLFNHDFPALLSGLLFSLHPLHVPVTTFLGGRVDTLALLFLLLFGIGLLRGVADRSPARAHASEVNPGQKASPSRPPRAALRRVPPYSWRLLSLLGFTCALFTKEQSVLLCALVLVPGSWRTASGKPRSWLLLYLVPVIGYVILATLLIPRAGYAGAGWTVPLHFEIVGRTLWYYAKLLLFPTTRSLHQSTLGSWDRPQIVATIIGYGCASVWLGLLVRWWSNRTLRYLHLWTTLTLLPCVNIIPLPSHSVASYRAFIPMLGVAGLAGRLLAGVPETVTRNRAVVLVRTLLPYVHSMGDFQSAGLFRMSPAQIIKIVAGTGWCLAALGVSWADVPMWRNNRQLGYIQVAANPSYLPSLVGLAAALHERAIAAAMAGETKNVELLLREALWYYDSAMAVIFPGARTAAERLALVDAPATLRRVRSDSNLRYEPRELISSIARGRGEVREGLGTVVGAIEDYHVALAAKPDDDWLREYLARLGSDR